MANSDVAIIGIGGGGGNLVHALARRHAHDWMDLIYADTGLEELDYVDGVVHLPLGAEWTRGLGCGGDALVGQRATSASVGEVRELIARARLVIVVGCLGGGTASGGAQILAELAREEDKLCFCLLTMPFAAEGNARREVAARELQTLRQKTDFVVAVQNDLLFTHFPAETNVTEAFALANDYFADGLHGIAGLVHAGGLLSVDFADLRTLLRDREATCALGVGRATGEDRTVAVIDELFASPLLGGRDFVQAADAVVATLAGGPDLHIGELNECLNALNAQLSDHTRVLLGSLVSEELAGDLRLTMLAIQYAQEPTRNAPMAAHPHPALPLGEAKPPPHSRAATTTRVQGDLFTEESFSVGIFGDCTPTMHKSQNLDIPTFRRLNLDIDLEDPG